MSRTPSLSNTAGRARGENVTNPAAVTLKFKNWEMVPVGLIAIVLFAVTVAVLFYFLKRGWRGDVEQSSCRDDTKSATAGQHVTVYFQPACIDRFVRSSQILQRESKLSADL